MKKILFFCLISLSINTQTLDTNKLINLNDLNILFDFKKNDWNDMEQAWLDDPQSAANHMVFGMNLTTRQKARQLKGNNQVANWV